MTGMPKPECDRHFLKELEAGCRSSAPGTEMLFRIFWRLYDSFGPQHWWPGDSPFEIAVGAILTQNTAWKNVEKAIASLKARGCLSPEAIWEMPVQVLAAVIKPAGYFNVKARRLRNFVKVLIEDFQGDMGLMARPGTEELREVLLGINGIGPETADSILLYALGKPSFVIDAYTFRILERHDLIDGSWDYAMLQAFFMDNLPSEPCLYNEYHALLVMAGKTFCKPRKYACSECPLTGI